MPSRRVRAPDLRLGQPLEKTKLVVFSHKLFRRNASGLQTNGAFTVQMDALAAHFEQLTLCVPVVEDPSFRGESLTAANVAFAELPPFERKIDFLRLAPELRRAAVRATARGSLGLVILPGTFQSLASWLCQRRRYPLFQWVIGDWRRAVVARRRGRSTEGLVRLSTAILDLAMRRLTRDVLTFFNGRVLYPPSRPHHHTRVSSSLRSADVLQTARPDGPGSPRRLLFVGRLAGEKGLGDLLQAVHRLRSRGEDLRLEIVGSGEQGAVLAQEVERLALQPVVELAGEIPRGPELFERYRRSDLFVLPALEDLLPKVLLEAMSQGLPVVATRVGAIPTLVVHGRNGLLVPPSDPAALASAISTALSERGLRQRLIAEGLATARRHTVEIETEKMIQILKRYTNASRA